MPSIDDLSKAVNSQLRDNSLLKAATEGLKKGHEAVKKLEEGIDTIHEALDKVNETADKALKTITAPLRAITETLEKIPGVGLGNVSALGSNVQGAALGFEPLFDEGKGRQSEGGKKDSAESDDSNPLNIAPRGGAEGGAGGGAGALGPLPGAGGGGGGTPIASGGIGLPTPPGSTPVLKKG